MMGKKSIQKQFVYLLKGFYIFSIFYICLIGFVKGGLSFKVTGTKTSFSVSNFCHPNTVLNNSSISSYDEVTIKIGDSTLIKNDNYSNCTKYISFINNISQLNERYRSYDPTPMDTNSSSNWDEAICYINQISPIIISSNGNIDQIGDFEVKCDIKFNDNGPHTITIEDPLYNYTSTPSSGQITKINIGITGTYKVYNYESQTNENYNYSSGNTTSINEMYGLPQLKILDLSNNKITSTQFLKSNVQNVGNLEKLDLSNNKISSIDSNNLGTYNNLKELNLSSNKLSNISSDTFKNSSLQKLEYLDLSKNEISNIGPNSFYKVKGSSSTGLQELRLDGQNSNSLTIEQYAFSGLNKLTSLYLQNNGITELIGHSFYGLTNIQNLYLQNNQINSIRTYYQGEDPFDNFATNSSGKILVDLSNNYIKSTKPSTEIWKSLPDSLSGLLKKFTSGGTRLILGPTTNDEFRNKEDGTYKLALNLTNNQINYIKIKNNSSTDTIQTFSRFGYSYNHTLPKYVREVKNGQGDTKQSGTVNGINGNNNTDINLGESFKGTLHIYILSGSEKVAHDEINNIKTENNSSITIKEGDNEIQNNYEFPFRRLKLKIKGQPGNIGIVHYTYEIKQGTQFYLSGTFSGNTFQDIFHFNENGNYSITVKMYDSDNNEIKNESKTFKINVPYDKNILKIIYPESSGMASTGTLDHILRSQDRNNQNIDYGEFISGFSYEIIDGNGISHTSGFKKINPKNSEIYPYRYTGYEAIIPNPNLHKGRYTLTIKTIDIDGIEIGSPKSITFDKGQIFTINFDSKGGSSIPSKEVGEGELLSRPSNPTKAGYTFIGRYTDNSLTKEYNFSSSVNQNFTLYAKREINNNDSNSNLYTLTINYVDNNGSKVSDPYIQNLESGTTYNVTSPIISNYTTSQNIISGVMLNSNIIITVVYTKVDTSGGGGSSSSSSSSSSNYSNDLSLRVTNKNPDVDERVKLTINVNEKYTGKVKFPKLQYYNGSRRINIYNTSSSYVSDYCDDLDIGYVQFRSSDYGSMTISKFIKFSRSGKYRIYAEDKDGDDFYVQINVGGDDSSSNSSDSSDLTISVSSTSPKTYEPIDLTIKTDNYVGRLNLYAKYRELTSSYRITLNNTSSEYLSDYSNIWKNGYYKMTSSDKGKKILYNLIEFKKPGTYRIYVEDKEGYSNFIQIYVNQNNNTNTDSLNTNRSYTGDSSEDDEIERLIRELFNKSGSNSSLNSSSVTDIERNKQNIKSSSEEVYESRSCKKYRIQYNAGLGVYTSPDLKNNEYFINKEYFKRYIDSKNPQKENCPINSGWISTSFKDTSSSNEYFIAPNGKVYFITNENGTYKSSGLSKQKQFKSLSEIKYYIRDRNPLIGMGSYTKTTHNSGEQEECTIDTLTNNLTNPVTFYVGDSNRKIVFNGKYSTQKKSVKIGGFYLEGDHLATGDSINFYVSVNGKYFMTVTLDDVHNNIATRETEKVIEISNGEPANIKVEAEFNGTNYNKTYYYKFRLSPEDNCDSERHKHITNLAPITIKY